MGAQTTSTGHEGPMGLAAPSPEHLSDDPPGWSWESAETIAARDAYVEPDRKARFTRFTAAAGNRTASRHARPGEDGGGGGTWVGGDGRGVADVQRRFWETLGEGSAVDASNERATCGGNWNLVNQPRTSLWIRPRMASRPEVANWDRQRRGAEDGGRRDEN